jgi:hypothetical protein
MRTSLSTKVALLQAKAVANGATPAEARAAAKVTELTQADERENAARILMDQHGWSEVQANGVVSCFDRLPIWDGRDDQWRFSEIIKELFDDLKRRYAQASLVPCSKCGSRPRVLILDYEDDDPRKLVALCDACQLSDMVSITH